MLWKKTDWLTILWKLLIPTAYIFTQYPPTLKSIWHAVSAGWRTVISHLSSTSLEDVNVRKCQAEQRFIPLANNGICQYQSLQQRTLCFRGEMICGSSAWQGHRGPFEKQRLRIIRWRFECERVIYGDVKHYSHFRSNLVEQIFSELWVVIVQGSIDKSLQCGRAGTTTAYRGYFQLVKYVGGPDNHFTTLDYYSVMRVRLDFVYSWKLTSWKLNLVRRLKESLKSIMGNMFSQMVGFWNFLRDHLSTNDAGLSGEASTKEQMNESHDLRMCDWRSKVRVQMGT